MGIGPVWTLERLRIQSKRSSVASEGFWLGSVTIARGGEAVTGRRLQATLAEWATAWPGRGRQENKNRARWPAAAAAAADERWRRWRGTSCFRRTQGQGGRELVGLGTAASLRGSGLRTQAGLVVSDASLWARWPPGVGSGGPL